jgi:ferredoxin
MMAAHGHRRTNPSRDGSPKPCAPSPGPSRSPSSRRSPSSGSRRTRPEPRPCHRSSGCGVCVPRCPTGRAHSRTRRPISTTLSGTTDLPTAKTTVVDFLSQAVDATDTAIADLRGAGVPDTTNGKKIRARLLKGFGKAQAIFAEAESNAEGLPTDDLTSFKQAGQGIAADISNGGNEVEAGFGGISGLDKGDELGKAAKSVKACSFLTS